MYGRLLTESYCSTINRLYILARLEKNINLVSSLRDSYPEIESNEELSNTILILDALEDLDISEYPIEYDGELLVITRKSLIGCILGIELVLRSKRFMYLVDADTYDLRQELGRRLSGVLPQLQELMSVGGFHTFTLSGNTSRCSALISSIQDDDHPALVMCEYGYTKKDHMTHPNVVVQFLINDMYLLYMFSCPMSKYQPRILAESIEKAKEFTEALSPLGFVITAKLIHDEV